mgnify:FL=1
MSVKIDVLPVIQDHYDTLVDQQPYGAAPKVNPWDIATQYGLPVLAAAGALLAGTSLKGLSSLLAGAAILTAFSFGLAVFAFQTRAADTSTAGSHRRRLLDEFFGNVLYSVLVGLGLTTTLMVSASQAANPDQAGPLGTAIIIALGLHYLLILLMCIKRLRAAYLQLPN